MDALKDSKKQPYIIAGVVVILIGVVIGLLFETGVLPPKSNATVAVVPGGMPGAATAPGMPGGVPVMPGAMPAGAPPRMGMPAGAAPGMTPGIPAASRPGGVPGAFGGAPGGLGVTAAPGGMSMPGMPGGTGMPAGVRMPGGTGMPGMNGLVPNPAALLAAVNVSKGPDPFVAAGSNGKPVTRVPRPPRPPLRLQIPMVSIQRYATPDTSSHTPQGPRGGGQTDTAKRRVEGVVQTDNGVFAIVETNGQSQSVQPGDTLADGSKVQSIQSDSVTIRTPGNQIVNVLLSAGNGTDTGQGGGSPYPGAPGMGMPPGMGMGMPGIGQ